MANYIFALVGIDGNRQIINLEESNNVSIHLKEIYYSLEVRQCDDLTWLEINDEDIELDGVTNLTIPIIWKSDYSVSLMTWVDGNEYSCEFYVDEKKLLDKKLQATFSDFRKRLSGSMKKKRSVEDVVKMVNSGTLPLLRMANLETEMKDDSLIQLIDEKLQFAFNICNRPRLHLRSETELLDIERVKRINEQSLRHLASHSEHWKARTLSGVIPSRMNAEILEDDYDIYENIFFRMSMERLALFINEEINTIESAINQNDNLIDWERYSNQFSDYSRMKLIGQIMPDFDSETIELSNMEYAEVLMILKSIEKRLLGIQWSRNYQRINKIKVLSRPIIPTNILNMDKNYHEIYRLWNQMEKVSVANPSVGVEGTIASYVHESYFDFVSVVLIHALSQIECPIDNEKSTVIFSEEEGISLQINLSNDQLDIEVRNTTDDMSFQVIEILFREKLNLCLALPEGIIIDNLRDHQTFTFDIDEKANTIVFKMIPDSEEYKRISSIYKVQIREEKDETRKRRLGKSDKVWRKFVSDNLDNTKKLREKKIILCPTVENFNVDELDFESQIMRMFNRKFDGDSVYFVAPFELYKKDKYENTRVMDMCLNYGEIPYKAFNSYNRGFLPISQVEVNSVSRLMKIMKMSIARLSIEWDLDKYNCPICGSLHIHKIDEDTSKCDNPECGVVWGVTHCTGECGEYFAWIRPDINIESAPYRSNSHLQLINKKESWFGTRVITDFDLDLSQRNIKFLPRCPYCG